MLQLKFCFPVDLVIVKGQDGQCPVGGRSLPCARGRWYTDAHLTAETTHPHSESRTSWVRLLLHLKNPVFRS